MYNMTPLNFHWTTPLSRYYLYIFFFVCFLVNQCSFFVIFSSVAPHRGQPAAMCHPRWQPIRRLADSCGMGRRRIRTRDCRTTVWLSTIELPHLQNWTTTPPKLNYHASHWTTTPPILNYHASRWTTTPPCWTTTPPTIELPRLPNYYLYSNIFYFVPFYCHKY